MSNNYAKYDIHEIHDKTNDTRLTIMFNEQGGLVKVEVYHPMRGISTISGFAFERAISVMTDVVLQRNANDQMRQELHALRLKEAQREAAERGEILHDVVVEDLKHVCTRCGRSQTFAYDMVGGLSPESYKPFAFQTCGPAKVEGNDENVG